MAAVIDNVAADDLFLADGAAVAHEPIIASALIAAPIRTDPEAGGIGVTVLLDITASICQQIPPIIAH